MREETVKNHDILQYWPKIFFSCFFEPQEKNHRKKGYGRELLLYLENKYKDSGYNNINLVTSAFQAPKFYENCGYELEFVRKNIFNPKLSKYFYIKYFDNDYQHKGIIKDPN